MGVCSLPSLSLYVNPNASGYLVPRSNTFPTSDARAFFNFPFPHFGQGSPSPTFEISAFTQYVHWSQYRMSSSPASVSAMNSYDIFSENAPPDASVTFTSSPHRLKAFK